MFPSKAEMDAARAAAEAEQFATRARDLGDLKELMRLPSGRRTFWRLLGASGVFVSSFTGEQPLTMAFAEGRRNEGLRLFLDLQEADGELYLLMAQEAAAAEKRAPEAPPAPTDAPQA
jgi:hypothetical protein